MTAQLEMIDAAPRLDDAIVVAGLRKSFGATPVLDGIDLTVGRGTVFALLGANGSGKTTTINILTTLIAADGGTASVAGFDVARQPAQVRERISVTGQFAAVDPVLTGRENLVLMGELRHVADPRQTAVGLLHRFDLAEAADRRLLTYSGGMRRRLDIAMSLVGGAPVIFFDEPTTGLDPKSRNHMWLTIRQLVEQGTTVFLTTQYLEEADRLADDVAILHDGRIVASGTPDELKAMVPTGLVEFEFGDREQATVAQRALGARHEVSGVDSKLVVATTGSAAEMADMFIRLKESGIEPAGFSQRLPTLDDVFFKILDDGNDTKEDERASAH
jgi:ABC-2 type transport system ATP-binding protein